MEPSAGEVRVCGRSVALEPLAVAQLTGNRSFDNIYLLRLGGYVILLRLVNGLS